MNASDKSGPRVLAVIVLALALAGAAILFQFDPSRYSFYPTCLFHRATGWLCPGCGSLRAIHQLLHGHLAAAFRFNPLLVLALPLLAWFGARSWLTRSRGDDLAGTFSAKWLLLALAILLAFSVWRNLPNAAGLRPAVNGGVPPPEKPMGANIASCFKQAIPRGI